MIINAQIPLIAKQRLQGDFMLMPNLQVGNIETLNVVEHLALNHRMVIQFSSIPLS
jgi:hypothetical protein